MAQRSVDIVLVNQTSQQLTLTGAPVLQHGILVTQPPATIPPNSSGTWDTESNGLATGTQGSVSYTFQGAPAQLVQVNWDNPFIGESTYSMNYPFPGFSATINNGTDIVAGLNGTVTITGGGNNAKIIYTLTAS